MRGKVFVVSVVVSSLLHISLFSGLLWLATSDLTPEPINFSVEYKKPTTLDRMIASVAKKRTMTQKSDAVSSLPHQDVTAVPKDENLPTSANTKKYFTLRVGYPEKSRALGEEGAVTVTVLYNSKNKTVMQPTVVKSSGYWRLDTAALAAVSDSNALNQFKDLTDSDLPYEIQVQIVFGLSKD